MAAARAKKAKKCKECGAELRLGPAPCPLCGAEQDDAAASRPAAARPATAVDPEDYQSSVRNLREQLRKLRDEGAEAV